MSDLRKLFGPAKEAIWNKLVDEIGGKYEDGAPWEGGKIIAKVEEWTVTLDVRKFTTQHDTILHTRFRAPFVNKDGFRFTIYRKGMFGYFSKILGLEGQDVEIGYPEFDKLFIIQGNDPVKLKEFFINQKVRETMLNQPDIRMRVKDDGGWFSDVFPEGVDELNLKVEGIVSDYSRLRDLFDLFSESLHQICNIGSAYK
ncbi:MAG: DUF3137 domain-containing protein [Candidatus Omnitrophica bacterium]|nr:DUF3137 domain-containing protein [Candidatus Omnitrophota bacterium]